MKRYPHYWWQLKGKRMPARIAVLDCAGVTQAARTYGATETETMSEWLLYVLSSPYESMASTHQYHGFNEAALWRTLGNLSSSNDRTWIFATPASRILPLIGFWEALERGRLELYGTDWRSPPEGQGTGEDRRDGVCVYEDPPVIIISKLPNRPGKLVWLDMRNWGIDPLTEIQEHDIRAERYTRGILSIVRTLRENGLGTLRTTAASQAVQTLRTKYPVRTMHCHNHEAATALERKSLHGGRCECYRIGPVIGPVFHLDVRNMYPALCLTLKLPVSIRRYHACEINGYTDDRASKENCIAHVRVVNPMPSLPHRRGELTIYPIGEYDTVIAGAELQYARSQGIITRWYAVAEYTTQAVLSGFYRTWLSLLATARARGRAQECQWIKRVMNSLPGKFAETGRRWVPAGRLTDLGPYGTWEQPDSDGNLVRWRNLAGYTQREEIYGESYHSIPAITSFITSAGRQALWNYLCTAGRENVWYVDTDSLITTREGYNRLQASGFVRDGEAGYLRVLGEHKTCVIQGYRHYQLDGSITCAGVPRGTIEPGQSRYDYWRRASIAEDVSMGIRPDGNRRLELFPPGHEYRHGVVNKDGSVSPIVV